jgi:hypothetical protein
MNTPINKPTVTRQHSGPHSGNMPDRVWVTYSEKVNIRGQFTPTEVGFGFASDVQPGEDPSDAMTRVFETVKEKVDTTLNSLEMENRQR